jgi:hypothetical protein
MAADPDPRTPQVVPERLVRILKPASYYVTTVVRAAGRPEMHLAFEDKGDARNLASLVDAEPTGLSRAPRNRVVLPSPIAQLHGEGCKDEQQQACYRHQQPQQVSPSYSLRPLDLSQSTALPNPTFGV